MRAIKLLVLSLCLLAGFGLPVQAETASSFVDKGNEALRAGNLKAAQFYLRRAVEAEPDNIEANRKLASLLIDTHDYERALSVLDRISKLAPKDAANWAKMGDLCTKVNDPQAAVVKYTHAIECAPGNSEYVAARGFVESDSGMYRYALDDFDRVLKAKQDAGIYYARARLRNKFSQNDAALADLNHAIKLDSRLVDAYLLRSTVLHDSGYNDLAAQDMKTYNALKQELARTEAVHHPDVAAPPKSRGILKPIRRSKQLKSSDRKA